MLQNYLKIALRNLWKNKTYALINVLGMSVAFASCLLLFLTAYHELSFDGFHANADRLFMLYNQTGPNDKWEVMSAPLTPALKKEFPEAIRHISRIVDGGNYIRYNNKEISQDTRYVDADFLSMFSFPVTKGQNAQTALRNLSDVVMTEHAARAIFGKETPLVKPFL